MGEASVAPFGPLKIVAVTTTPAWLTGLPFASSSCTTGCRASTTPLCAAAEGCVTSASLFAAATATRKSVAPMVPKRTHGPGAVASRVRACQWYAVLSESPVIAAVATVPFATAGPEKPLAVLPNAAPTGLTSTSSRN